MTLEQKRKIGKQSREWAISKFSTEVTGKFLENFIDSAPFADFNFESLVWKARNPKALIPNSIEDDSEWLIYMYKHILNMEVNRDNDGHKYWMTQLNNKVPKNNIEDFFRNKAKEENQENTPFSLEEYLDKDETFCMTYGDGLSNVNISKLVEYHKKHKCLATVTAAIAPGRFGALSIDGDSVNEFMEKPKGDNVYINGGFFVLSEKVIDLIKDDKTFWEREPLESLAKNNQLIAFKHNGFWQPMDTLRERNLLQELWDSGKAPWKVW